MAQSTCSPSAKPGAKAVLKLLIKTWGGSSSGISRACGAGSRSEHKEGRALDWHMSVKKASQRKRVNAALSWITANNGEVALRLGIMYVIWNQHIWSVYYPELGWRLMEDRGGSTANHKDRPHLTVVGRRLSADVLVDRTTHRRPVELPLRRTRRTGCLPVIGRTTAAWPYQSTTVPASFTPRRGFAPASAAAPGGHPPAGRTRFMGPVRCHRHLPVDLQRHPDSGSHRGDVPDPAGAVGHEVEVSVTATAADGTPWGPAPPTTSLTSTPHDEQQRAGDRGHADTVEHP